MIYAPSEDSGQPVHIHPVWSESSLSAWRKFGSSATQWTHSEDSDQTGLSLRWAHRSFCWFCRAAAYLKGTQYRYSAIPYTNSEHSEQHVQIRSFKLRLCMRKPSVLGDPYIFEYRLGAKFCCAPAQVFEVVLFVCLCRGFTARAMVLGSFQCLGVLLLWHVIGQGPAVLAAGAERVGCFFFVVFFFCCCCCCYCFHLLYPIFLF